MIRKGIGAAVVVTMCAIAFSQTTDPAQSDKPLPKGQRIFICGHSFHMPVAGLLPEIVKSAGITDQKPVGQQRMSGSTVMQHWNLADDQNTLKKALRAGEVDVLTLSPTAQLPDEGIDKFTALALEHNANIRILVQASWAGFDSPTADPRKFKNEQRDVAKPEDRYRQGITSVYRAVSGTWSFSGKTNYITSLSWNGYSPWAAGIGSCT
jgi:hypothetical protein